MASRITTYCSGPWLWIMKDVTKDDFMQICDQMGCHPEAICEGGFKFINTPGYRSIRIYTNAATDMEDNRRFEYNWPFINPETVAVEWRGNKEILFRKGRYMGTCLKAFDGAYPFTIEELTAFREIWKEYGILAQTAQKKTRQIQWCMET